MYALIKLFFDIAVLEKGPQDIPASPWLLRLLIPIYMAVNFLILLLSSEAVNALLQVIVEVALIILFSWCILFYTGKLPRFQQTTTALLGTDTLISLFAFPAIATLIGLGSALALVVVVLLMLWHWVVTGHIFRHALSQPLIFGLGIAFLYIVVSYQVMAFLFPEFANHA